MRIALFSNGSDFQNLLYKSIKTGLREKRIDYCFHHIDDYKIATGFDVAIRISIASPSGDMLQFFKKNNIPFIMIDKGFFRLHDHQYRYKGSKCLYYKFSCNSNQPTHYLHKITPDLDRLKQTGIEFIEFRNKKTGHIIFAGSSQKYCDFHGLGDATLYAEKVINQIKESIEIPREIIYRPKPTWKNATHIRNTRFSRGGEHFDRVVKSAYCVVTHGSNACLEALLLGYPSIILGNGIIKKISATSIDSIEKLFYANNRDKKNCLGRLVRCQFTIDEMKSGLFWDITKRFIERHEKND